jgi:hypothetical protein
MMCGIIRLRDFDQTDRLIVVHLMVVCSIVGLMGLQKCSMKRAFHWHKPESIKSLKIMILNESPHENSKKLS